MTLARFKSVCMDASDPLAQARFWATILDARLVDLGDGTARVDPGPREGAASIWVDPVPEPRTGKTRVHLDLRLAAPDPSGLVAAGATVVREPGEDRWWVLTDPEGNVFCAHPPEGPPGIIELNVDCHDPMAQATWWAGIVGGEVGTKRDFAWVAGGAGFPWDAWIFGWVPEPKTVKNRLHWDVMLTGPSPQPLLDAGASLLREHPHWWVLADPEGNEFCAFPPPD